MCALTVQMGDDKTTAQTALDAAGGTSILSTKRPKVESKWAEFVSKSLFRHSRKIVFELGLYMQTLATDETNGKGHGAYFQ